MWSVWYAGMEDQKDERNLMHQRDKETREIVANARDSLLYGRACWFSVMYRG